MWTMLLAKEVPVLGMCIQRNGKRIVLRSTTVAPHGHMHRPRPHCVIGEGGSGGCGGDGGMNSAASGEMGCSCVPGGAEQSNFRRKRHRRNPWIVLAHDALDLEWARDC